MRSLEECKEILRDLDARTLERRAERLRELENIETDARRFSSEREWSYLTEATDVYINGHYRSAIFCCAFAVDQIFRYEYLKTAEGKYDDLENLTFGQLIGECERQKVASLCPYIEKAKLLNYLRNKVATHPLFIDVPIDSDLTRQMRRELICKDIAILLALVGRLDLSRRLKIESSVLRDEAKGMSYVFGEVISHPPDLPSTIDGFWGLIEQEVLKFLAKQARNIVKTISEGLYGVE